MNKEKETIPYKQINLSLTDSHIARLDKLAHKRTFNRSLMVRVLIDEEWEREEKREAQRRGRASGEG